DVSPERLASALASINGSPSRQVASQEISEADRKATLARRGPVADVDGLADAQLVIDAVVGDEAVKRGSFGRLCPPLDPDAALGTNTSAISIPRLAAATDRPEKFIGIHFMNPVPVMELVELVRGIATDDETFETTRGFVGSLDRTIAVSEDFPAFMVNRILLP